MGPLWDDGVERFGGADAFFERAPATAASRQSVGGRAFVERTLVHVHDMAQATLEEFPAARPAYEQLGHRTQVTVPLLLSDEPIGVLSLTRMEVRPFSARQIALLEAFADQAVIAIENSRLFEALERRTTELTQSARSADGRGRGAARHRSSPTTRSRCSSRGRAARCGCAGARRAVVAAS